MICCRFVADAPDRRHDTRSSSSTARAVKRELSCIVALLLTLAFNVDKWRYSILMADSVLGANSSTGSNRLKCCPLLLSAVSVSVRDPETASSDPATRSPPTWKQDLLPWWMKTRTLMRRRSAQVSLYLLRLHKQAHVIKFARHLSLFKRHHTLVGHQGTGGIGFNRGHSPGAGIAQGIALQP